MASVETREVEVTVKLSPETVRKIEKIAEERATSVSNVVEEQIEAMVRKSPRTKKTCAQPWNLCGRDCT